MRVAVELVVESETVDVHVQRDELALVVHFCVEGERCLYVEVHAEQRLEPFCRPDVGVEFKGVAECPVVVFQSGQGGEFFSDDVCHAFQQRAVVELSA